MPDSDAVSLKRPGTWPRRARLGLEAIVTVMTNAYMMARSRAAGSPSKTVVLMAERDDALWRAARAVGAMPRFIVTDHGPQFVKRFGKLVSRPKTRVVRCRVHCFKLNGKVERFFRTLKTWARMKLFAWFEDRKRIARRMQGRLDVFRD